MDIEPKKLSNETIKLPINRSLYLNQLLKEIKGTEIIKDEQYKNLIKSLTKENIEEEIKLPENLDYSKLDGLALEARQKFNLIQPKNIGQASRISGVNPSDINALILHLKKGINK